MILQTTNLLNKLLSIFVISPLFNWFGAKESAFWMYCVFILVILAAVATIMQSRSSDREHDLDKAQLLDSTESLRRDNLAMGARLRELDIELAKAYEELSHARTKQAEAEKELTLIKRSAAPLYIKTSRIVDVLSEATASRAEIHYATDDVAAEELARAIHRALESAHWSSRLVPDTSVKFTQQGMVEGQIFHLRVRVDASVSLGWLESTARSERETSAMETLRKALSAGEIKIDGPSIDKRVSPGNIGIFVPPQRIF